jgi:3-hydroxyacyl-[acyl-carrier-protein] dehydratase
VQFNRSHKIFEGHFPGQPVVPGVCMMQMIKEIMEKIRRRKLQLTSASNMKFLSLIDPNQFAEVNTMISWVDAEQGSIAITASLFSGELIFFKMNATFQPE